MTWVAPSLQIKQKKLYNNGLCQALQEKNARLKQQQSGGSSNNYNTAAWGSHHKQQQGGSNSGGNFGTPNQHGMGLSPTGGFSVNPQGGSSSGTGGGGSGSGTGGNGSGESPLSGEAWYQLQAFRALNQVSRAGGNTCVVENGMPILVFKCMCTSVEDSSQIIS